LNNILFIIMTVSYKLSHTNCGLKIPHHQEKQQTKETKTDNRKYIPPHKKKSHCNCQNLKWSQHAIDRKNERNIDLDPEKINIERVLSLPYYTNGGCYHYCDSKEGVTYYVRKINNEYKLVTIIKRNPIAMARRICEIKGINFNEICRDNLFGNCRRGCSCKYKHIDI